MWSWNADVRIDSSTWMGKLTLDDSLTVRATLLTRFSRQGCQLNAPLGFRYLQMAAESVVEDLDRVVFGGRTLTESEANTKAAKVRLDSSRSVH